MPKNFVAGASVRHRHDRLILGKVLRVYPFDDNPNTLVKWSDGRVKSYFPNDLKVA
jgi:hypothetical protein